DSASNRDKRAAIEADQRWSVSNMATSSGADSRGYGFAWISEVKVRSELSDGVHRLLRVRGGSERLVEMELGFPDRGAAGSGTLRLAEVIREQVARVAK